MKALQLTAGKTAGLLGFGISNQALLAYLLSKGCRVTVRDRQPLDCPDLAARSVRLIVGEGYLDHLHEDILFRSPGLRPDIEPITQAVKRGAQLSSEFELFAALCPAPLLGVTGSDGKTTTTTIAGLMLREAGHTAWVGGNIGEPLIGHLDEIKPCDLALCELSSFQLMTGPRPPHRAVITNLTENHLNWHRDMQEYATAKERILGPGTHAVLNADNPYTAAIAGRRADKTLFSSTQSASRLRAAFGACHTVTVEDGALAYDGKPLLPLSDIRLPGRHNVENYLAAIGLVYPYVHPSAMQAVACRFGGVAHRMEYLGKANGVTYYNSSIDSTPSRTAATLAALGKKPILLCGGKDKGLSLAPLREAALTHAKAILLFGEAGAKLREALDGLSVPIKVYAKMREAVAAAQDMAQPGDCILLSPACTSFDEFRNFEERGEAFRQAFLSRITTEEIPT